MPVTRRNQIWNVRGDCHGVESGVRELRALCCQIVTVDFYPLWSRCEDGQQVGLAVLGLVEVAVPVKCRSTVPAQCLRGAWCQVDHL